MSIADNVARVRDEIANACLAARRDLSEIRLIAVTKAQSPAVLAELAAVGLHEYGENRIEHLAELTAAAPSTARFHHIGRIQSRQIPDLARLAACIHGLADADHAVRLDRACATAGKQMPVFLQVNTSGEASKAGCAPTALPALLDSVRGLSGLMLLGLMTMAPPWSPEGGDATPVRQAFARLRELAYRHGLTRLSMGMSGDFALAIAEGATDLRIGSRLFQ